MSTVLSCIIFHFNKLVGKLKRYLRGQSNIVDRIRFNHLDSRKFNHDVKVVVIHLISMLDW